MWVVVSVLSVTVLPMEVQAAHHQAETQGAVPALVMIFIVAEVQAQYPVITAHILLVQACALNMGAGLMMV